MFGLPRAVKAVCLSMAVLAAAAGCAVEEDDEGNLGNAIELCTAEHSTNVETSYEQIAEMLALVSVSASGADFETEVEVRPLGGVLDPTNSNEDAQDYVDQPGEIACVTEDGRLVFNVGGIILYEAQKLMSDHDAESESSTETTPSTSTTTTPPFPTETTDAPDDGDDGESEGGDGELGDGVAEE